MTPGLFFKSLLLPGYGSKQRKMWTVRRPQIAKPCGILGKINLALLFGGFIAFWFLGGFF